MAITPAGIDVAAATARRIPVTAVPPFVTEATADLHWALLLAVARRVVEGDRALRSGIFPGSQSMHFVGGEVNGKTLGIVGLGADWGSRGPARQRISTCGILYTKRHRLDEAREAALGVEYRSLDDLLKESDFVSVNAALSPETVHLIGAARIEPHAAVRLSRQHGARARSWTRRLWCERWKRSGSRAQRLTCMSVNRWSSRASSTCRTRC